MNVLYETFYQSIITNKTRKFTDALGFEQHDPFAKGFQSVITSPLSLASAFILRNSALYSQKSVRKIHYTGF